MVGLLDPPDIANLLIHWFPNLGHIRITWRAWQKYKGLGGILFRGSWPLVLSSFPGDSNTHLAVVAALEDTSEGTGGVFHAKRAGAQLTLIQNHPLRFILSYCTPAVMERQ